MSRLPGFRLIVIVALVLSGIGLFKLNQSISPVKAATANHVVISEIMVGVVGDANNEFVELYNPTNNSISLEDWSIKRKASTGDNIINLKTLSGSIPAYGFYLLAHTAFDGEVEPDETYGSNPITGSNTIYLYNNENELIDKVGMGDTNDYFGSPATSPPHNTSIERKARATSTSESMAVGGADEFLGNTYNTNNNAADFVTRSQPQPQNSQSPVQTPPSVEVPIDPTPTPEPEITPTLTPAPDPTPTPQPVVTPSPTPIPQEPTTPESTIVYQTPFVTCNRSYRTVVMFWRVIHIPFVHCSIN